MYDKTELQLGQEDVGDSVSEGGSCPLGLPTSATSIDEYSYSESRSQLGFSDKVKRLPGKETRKHPSWIGYP